MQALLGIAVKSLTDKPADPNAVLEERVEEAKRVAEERVREESQEWDQADDESDDGGVPIAWIERGKMSGKTPTK